MNFIKQNGWKITVTILAIIAFAITINLVHEIMVEAPAREAQIAREEAVKAEVFRQLDYERCLETAYEVYSAGWDSKCEIIGEEADCILLPSQYTPIEDRYTEAKDRCDTRYGK